MNEALKKKETLESEMQTQRERLMDLKSELRKKKEAAASVEAEVDQLDREKAVKLKFLASVLLYNQLDTYTNKKSKLRSAWRTWVRRVGCGKLADQEIARVAGTNQRQVARRYTAAAQMADRWIAAARAGLKELAFRAVIRAGTKSCTSS